MLTVQSPLRQGLFEPFFEAEYPPTIQLTQNAESESSGRFFVWGYLVRSYGLVGSFGEFSGWRRAVRGWSELATIMEDSLALQFERWLGLTAKSRSAQFLPITKE